MTRTCAEPDCGKPIKPKNKTGLCGEHAKSDPAYRAKLAESQRRVQAVDPTIRRRKSERMREIAATPEWRARNAQSCRERRLWEKGLAGRTDETPAKWGRTFSQRHGFGAWCPPDYIELARDLRRKGTPLDETQRLVREQHNRDLQRFRASVGAEPSRVGLLVP